MTKIKICGLTRREDILAVNRYLPDYIGFVFAKSRRQVTAEQAQSLRGLLHPSICPVGVFVNEQDERICELAEKGIIRMAQLHGQETPEQVSCLKRLLKPLGVPVIKAVRMESEDSLKPWIASDADYLLLDAGSGGTGRAFDHRLIERAGTIGKPWFLAGGMNPENVSEAISHFRPYAVDVSSGVETDGRKDAAKIEKMIRKILEKPSLYDYNTNVNQ